MGRNAWLAAAAVAALSTTGLRAQQPPPVDSVRAERLRQEIERRFETRLRMDLGLSADQMQKLRATHEQFFPRQRALAQEQMAVRRALQQQLRPGEAANADSVRQLNDALATNRRRMFDLEQEQDRALGQFLTPVQLVRYRQMREALMQRVQDVRRRRGVGVMRPGNGSPAPGARPRPAERPRRRPA